MSQGGRVGVRARDGLVLAAAAGAVVATIALGYYTLFSTLAPYDDEGYFLISVKGYLSGARLYNDIYGPYGPFFFQALVLSFKGLRLAITNDGARFVTLLYWVLASALLALAAYRMTGRRLVGLLVYPISFRVLTLAPNEPTAPGHLLMVLLAGMVAAAAFLSEQRPRLAMGLIGAFGAAAVLTKVNIGGFALISIVFAILMASPKVARKRTIPLLVAGGFALTPIALMGRNLDSIFVRTYGLHVLFCAVALGIVALSLARRLREAEAATSVPIRWLAAGGLTLALPAVATVLAQGTTVSAVAHSLVLEAAKQPTLFSLPLPLPAQTLSIDVISIAAAGVAASIPVAALIDRRAEVFGGVARIAVGLVIWYELLGQQPLGLPATLAWVAAVPAPQDRLSARSTFLRLFLPSLAILQTLHAYPVAGSQVVWSSFLFAAVGAICLADGMRVVGRLPLSGVTATAAVATLCVWVVVRTLANPIHSAKSGYDSGVPIRVNGATRIHASTATASTYEWLARTIRRRCTTFVSSPGLDSLYVMSRKTPPTWTNIDDWLFGFGRQEQARVLRQVESVPGLCAIRNPTIEAIWAQGRRIPRYPLYSFILRDFRSVGTKGDFRLMIRRSA